MITVLSPAKTLDFDNPAGTRKHTQPQFLDQAATLNAALRKYPAGKLGKLMSISKDLSELNARRNREWAPPFTTGNAKQALFAFRGDVYTGLEADSFDTDDLAFAQKHLRVLSGLYGLLRPLDLIQPYRLEMGTKLANPKGKDLYAYWDETITAALNKAMRRQDSKVLLNLASNEYFSAVDTKQLDATVIAPQFKEYRKGQYRVLSFFAKKARGQMAAWIIRHRIDNPDAVLAFDLDGYRYNKALSTPEKPVFARKSA